MRKISTFKLSKLQQNEYNKLNFVNDYPSIKIASYSQLVSEVAELSFLYDENMLFFRGQNENFTLKGENANKSTFYPGIYRDRKNDKNNSLSQKVRILNQASELLIHEVRKREINGVDEIVKKRYLQWSILQHYEICETPLLDLTHSLRVACSFALLNNNKNGYLYVFALPYVTNRISTNSEQETVIVRLLSICPPDALRPYYQDGYLVGTEFVVEEYNKKNELDFNRRLVGNYEIINNESFWDQDVAQIPGEILYPNRHDIFYELANDIKRKLLIQNGINENNTYEIGDFIVNFNKLQLIIRKLSRQKNDVYRSKINNINNFYKGMIKSNYSVTKNDLRNFTDQILAIIKGETYDSEKL